MHPDDDIILTLALDAGYTPTDEFDDDEVLSFAHSLLSLPTAETSHNAETPKARTPDAWWNGFSKSDPDDGTRPSFSVTEDTWHDIPLYAGVNPSRLAVTLEATRALPDSADPSGHSVEETFDKLMEQAQVFASAWALVGGRFDFGDGMADANAARNEFASMLRAALSARAGGEPTPDGALTEAQRFDLWWESQATGLGDSHRFSAWNAWLARALASSTKEQP